MAIETRISNEAYERLALAASDVKWELWDGVLREKPPMTAAHNHTAFELGYMLRSQLDPDDLPGACRRRTRSTPWLNLFHPRCVRRANGPVRAAIRASHP